MQTGADRGSNFVLVVPSFPSSSADNNYLYPTSSYSFCGCHALVVLCSAPLPPSSLPPSLPPSGLRRRRRQRLSPSILRERGGLRLLHLSLSLSLSRVCVLSTHPHPFSPLSQTLPFLSSILLLLQQKSSVLFLESGKVILATHSDSTMTYLNYVPSPFYTTFSPGFKPSPALQQLQRAGEFG